MRDVQVFEPFKAAGWRVEEVINGGAASLRCPFRVVAALMHNLASSRLVAYRQTLRSINARSSDHQAQIGHSALELHAGSSLGQSGRSHRPSTLQRQTS